MHLPSRSMLNRLLPALIMLWMNDAAAWGNLGHRVTGTIAASMLTGTAQRQVHLLLGDVSLAVAATDMDTQRAKFSEHWPQADQWHYNNQSICNDRPTPCRNGDCATAKIEEARKLLANRGASNAERAMALRVLVHLLGDIHQPLHMADNLDRGGNKTEVRLSDAGEHYNLHEMLDTVLVKQLIGQQRTRDYAMSLTRVYSMQLKNWQPGNVSEWAQQSHEIAVTYSYGELPGFACGHTSQQVITLPASYVQHAKQYLPEQLAKAGVRIAAVLNATLK
jgi:hypothetical protein